MGMEWNILGKGMAGWNPKQEHSTLKNGALGFICSVRLLYPADHIHEKLDPIL